MADQALKSLPKKVLKKILQEGKLSALIASDEGRGFFDSYMSSHPELKKYWDFYNSVTGILGSDNQETQLDLSQKCFDKHIAIEADSEDRVDGLFTSRTAVEVVKKAIDKQDTPSVLENFKGIQQQALEYLDQKVFRQLIPKIISESGSRSTTCGLC